MLTRRSLLVYCATAVAAAAIPLYVYFSGPNARFDVVTTACTWSMAPAIGLCLALPHQYFHDHTSLTPVDGDSTGRHERIVVSMLVGMNVLFWTIIATTILFVARHARKRILYSKSI